jgi:hypothetical protein
MEQGSVSHCKIIREGILDRYEMETAIIVIEGRALNIPRKKVDKTIKTGDIVVWNGELWSRKQ